MAGGIFTMGRTVTIEVPDEFLPQLDRTLARWNRHGKPPELTLLILLRHGLDMMDIPDRADLGQDEEEDGIPF